MDFLNSQSKALVINHGLSTLSSTSSNYQLINSDSADWSTMSPRHFIAMDSDFDVCGVVAARIHSMY